jgi:three-Cys-motif partner protein
MSKSSRGKPVQITFIDCFAGPWQVAGEQLEATSVSLTVKLMKKVHAQFGRNYPVRFAGIFIEPAPEAFESLQAYLATQTTSDVQLTAINGEFPSALPRILRYCTKESFCFFFVDPFGFQGVMPEDLKPILQRPDTELLINFMSDYANRFKGHPNDKIRGKFEGLMGGPVTDANANTVSAIYAQQLQQFKPNAAKIQYNAVMPVLMPGKFRRFYDLVYVTHHPLGLIEFKEVTERIHKEQLDIWAQQQHDRKAGNLDLFGIAPGDVDSKKFPIGTDASAIAEPFLAKLEKSNGVICFDVAVFAQMLIEFNCQPSQLQLCIKDLLERKLVKNISIKGKRTKKFVDYEKYEAIMQYDFVIDAPLVAPAA